MDFQLEIRRSLMLKTVIFDFDGTLADTLPIVYQSFQHIFEKYMQLEKSPEDIKAMFGPAENDIIRKHFPEEHIQAAITHYHDYYWTHHEEWVERSHEIEHVLAWIRKKGFKLAIMTGKGRKSLDLSLKALEMSDWFDMTVTGDEVDKPKPDPEGILKILKELNTLPEEAIFIGDSNSDIIAGKGAGLETVGVQWLATYQSPDFHTNPDHLFKNVQGLKRLLEERIKSSNGPYQSE